MSVKKSTEPSLREKEAAFRKSEAKRLNLHPLAVELAGKMLSIPMAGVELYSQHEYAMDLPLDDVARDAALRQVFQDLRWGTVPSRHNPIQPEYAAEEANSSREDATEAA
jgi:hypothetical protein